MCVTIEVDHHVIFRLSQFWELNTLLPKPDGSLRPLLPKTVAEKNKLLHTALKTSYGLGTQR